MEQSKSLIAYLIDDLIPIFWKLQKNTSKFIIHLILKYTVSNSNINLCNYHIQFPQSQIIKPYFQTNS